MTKSYERIFPPPRLPIFAGNKTRTPDRIETIRTDCIVAKWVCDVCRTASFDDYDEACRHEGECGGGVRMTAAAAVAARGNIESGDEERPEDGAAPVSVPVLAPTVSERNGREWSILNLPGLAAEASALAASSPSSLRGDRNDSPETARRRILVELTLSRYRGDAPAAVVRNKTLGSLPSLLVRTTAARVEVAGETMVVAETTSPPEQGLRPVAPPPKTCDSAVKGLEEEAALLPSRAPFPPPLYVSPAPPYQPEDVGMGNRCIVEIPPGARPGELIRVIFPADEGVTGISSFADGKAGLGLGSGWGPKGTGASMRDLAFICPPLPPEPELVAGWPTKPRRCVRVVVPMGTALGRAANRTILLPRRAKREGGGVQRRKNARGREAHRRGVCRRGHGSGSTSPGRDAVVGRDGVDNLPWPRNIRWNEFQKSSSRVGQAYQVSILPPCGGGSSSAGGGSRAYNKGEENNKRWEVMFGDDLSGYSFLG